MAEEGEVRLHYVAGDENAAVDVVFFHGLGGHHETTWTDDQSFSWPHELANEAAGVRVWTLEYPARRWCWTERGKKAVGDIQHIARLARAEMASKQSDGLMQGGKPCIWVCHSLGGLIAKRLLVDNQNCSHGGDKIDDGSVQGIMFLGTPHRGSDFADWAGKLRSVTQMVAQEAFSLLAKTFGWHGPIPDAMPGHLTDLVQELKSRSDGLWDLDSDFQSYFADRWQPGRAPLHVSVLAEGRSPFPGGFGPLIVDEKSADPRLRTSTSTQPVEPIIVSGLDHFQLSKPPSTSSLQFRYLLDLRYRVCSRGGRYAAYYRSGATSDDRAIFHLKRQLDQQIYHGLEFVDTWLDLPALESVDKRKQPQGKVIAVVSCLAQDGDIKRIVQASMAMATAVLKNQQQAAPKLRKHVDAVVAELLVFCAAPRHLGLSKHAVSYPGYRARLPDVDPLYLRAAQAQHKSMPAILPSANGVLTLEDLSSLDPTIRPIDAIEQWVHGPSEAQTLQEFAAQVNAPSSAPSDDDFKQGLETQVAQRIQDRGYLVIDARVGRVQEDLLSQFDRSPVLPILSVVVESDKGCGVEPSLNMAWKNYSEARSKHLNASINSARS